MWVVTGRLPLLAFPNKGFSYGELFIFLGGVMSRDKYLGLIAILNDCTNVDTIYHSLYRDTDAKLNPKGTDSKPYFPLNSSHALTHIHL